MRELPSGSVTGIPPSTVSHYSKAYLLKAAEDLVTNGAIEMSIPADGLLPEAAELLPYGMAAYVPHVRKRSLEDNLPALRALHRAGFDPVPHIAARQVKSLASLESFLSHAVEELGVHRVMLIGGDRAEAEGPFADGAALLKSGVLAGAGVHEVDVPGYPEGHSRIPPGVLAADLDVKLESADTQGLGLNIVTQFSFVPSRIVEYCGELALRAPQVPVYVGMAGPANAVSLVKFAHACGVSEAIRALTSLGVKAATLATHTDPDEQLDVLARYCAGHETCNVIGVHLFSFGGFAETARWMHGKFPHPLAAD